MLHVFFLTQNSIGCAQKRENREVSNRGIDTAFRNTPNLIFLAWLTIYKLAAANRPISQALWACAV